MNFSFHLVLAFVIRLVFIIFGGIQDTLSEVRFTDVDYKVFTDAARNVLEGKSVYARHTFRYSPLVAILLIPNVVLTPIFGKILFSVCDVLVSVVMQKILCLEGFTKSDAVFYTLLWLYNPLSIVISARGNMDSFNSLLVLVCLLMFKKKSYIFAGFLHALAIHFRLYPVIFSLAMYIAIEDKHKNKLINKLYPNRNRVKLVSTCFVSLAALSGLCYAAYGYDFINESILYHVSRQDIRHNYSVFFYMQYLGLDIVPGIYKFCMLLPQLVLLVVLSIEYGTVDNLVFCEFCLTFVLVTFNSVLTCQYFIWYLCLLPICVPYIKCSIKECTFVCCLWLFSQLAWLLPAYMLEFKGQDTYLWVWIHCLLFFTSNLVVLRMCLNHYNVKMKVS